MVHKYYRIGKPEIGQEHGAFRTRRAIADFLEFCPDEDCIPLPIYEIEGRISHDDGGPDGLTIKVSNFRKI